MAVTLNDYEKWKKGKAEQEKRISHGAEQIDLDSDLYRAAMAINIVCFENNAAIRYIPMYYIPAVLAEKHGDSVGLYGYHRIMIDKDFHQAHGTDDAVINTIFHEMVHMWCDIKGIQDTDGENHLEAFADACEEHGGRCEWENSRYGYNLAELTINSMKKVKKEMKR